MPSMNLLDTLKSQLYGTNQGSDLTQSETARQTLAASTGKALAPTSTQAGQTAIPELAAAQTANIQKRQIQNAGAIQAEQLGAENQAQMAAQAAQSSQIASQSKSAAADYITQTNGILSQFANGEKEVKTMDDISKLEYAGSVIRLQSQEYVANLQMTGNLARLNTTNGFNEAIYSSIFSSSESLFRDEKSFEAMLQANDATFQKALQSMDIEYAIKVAKIEGASASMQEAATGIGKLGSAGAQYASDSSKSSQQPEVSRQLESNFAPSGSPNMSTQTPAQFQQQELNYQFQNSVGK